MNSSNYQYNDWNSRLYDGNHDFVSKYGESLIPLLNPQTGESILDLGCGTGTLTEQIARSGAKVTGIDSSLQMIDEARQNFPDLDFIIGNGENFDLNMQFDAVFSNAALHWMLNPEQPVKCTYNALKPGGRFIFEMGGNGNIAIISAAINHALDRLNLQRPARVNYFPRLSEYASILEQTGFKVTYAVLYDRPTPLAGTEGLRNWIKMFRNGVLTGLEDKMQERLFEIAEEYAQPLILKNDTWVADYVRLRMVACKPN